MSQVLDIDLVVNSIGQLSLIVRLAINCFKAYVLYIVSDDL